MKKIIALLLVLAMALSLVACGGKAEAPAATEAPKAEAAPEAAAPAPEAPAAPEIKVAIKLMNGEEAEPVIVIPTTIVNAENVADHLDPSNNVY